MPTSPAAALNPIASILGGLGVGNNSDEWKQHALTSLWELAQGGLGGATDTFFSFASPLRDAILGQLGPLAQILGQQAGPLASTAEGQLAGIPELFANARGTAYTPEMQALVQALTGAAGGMQGTADLAAQGFAGGGWTPQYQQLFDTIAPFLSGRGNNAQLALGDVGPALLGQFGQTATTQGLQDAARSGVQTGGRNADLDFAMQMARSILQSGGATPSSQFGQGIAGQGLQGGGETPFTSALQNIGLEMAGQNPLMTPAQAATFAREDAARQIANQAEASRRAALSRGGTAGAITGAGAINEAMADFGDEGAALMSQSVRDALRQQQELGLQQRGMGGQFVGTGGGLASQNLGTFGDLFSALENAGVSRTGQAFGAIPGTQDAATQFMNALIQGGLGAGGLEVSRMGAGTDMSNALLQNMLGYGNLQNSTMGNQNQYALGLGNLFNNITGTQGGLLNNAFGNALGAGQLGLNLGIGQSGAQNSALQNWNAIFGNTSNAMGQFMNPLTSLAGNASGQIGNWINLLGQPFQGFGNFNAGLNWDKIGSGVVGLAGAFGL